MEKNKIICKAACMAGALLRRGEFNGLAKRAELDAEKMEDPPTSCNSQTNERARMRKEVERSIELAASVCSKTMFFRSSIVPRGDRAGWLAGSHDL